MQVIAAKYIKAGNASFHPQCFNCAKCSTPFPPTGAQYFTDGSAFYCADCHQSIANSRRAAIEPSSSTTSTADDRRNYRRSTIHKNSTTFVEQRKQQQQQLPPEIQALLGGRTATPPAAMSNFVKSIETGVDAADELAAQGGKKEGYLKKKGAKRRNWKRRYFKLSERTLTYHKTETVCFAAITPGCD
jgi:hypothetical protein